MLVIEMPKRVRSFFLFPCEHPQAEELGYAEMSQGGPRQRWLHCLPAGLGHPHPLAELVIHYKDPTKPKRLCPPRATLEMTTSRIDKNQLGSKFGQRNQADQLNFLFQIGFTLWGPGTGASGWRPPSVPSLERKIRAELCGNSFPCGFSDKWFWTATHQRSTSAVALNHNQNQPLVYLLSAWEEEGICLVNQRRPPAHGAEAHTQPLILSREGPEGKTQVQQCRTEVPPASSLSNGTSEGWNLPPPHRVTSCLHTWRHLALWGRRRFQAPRKASFQSRWEFLLPAFKP